MFSHLYKFNKTTLGKTCGTKWGAIGTCVGIHWKLDGNTGRTWWEQQKFHPPGSPKEKKNCVYWVHAIIPHWFIQISIPSCVHHLFWPGFVLFQFCEVCGLMISTWGLSQIWLKVIEESRFFFNPANTLPIHLSNSLDEVPPRFKLFCCNEPIWLAHHSKKNWNYGASPK